MLIEDKVKAIIVKCLGVEIEEVVPEASLKDDLGADDPQFLDLYELSIEIAEELGIEIPDEEVQEFKTVQDVLDSVCGQVAEA